MYNFKSENFTIEIDHTGFLVSGQDGETLFKTVGAAVAHYEAIVDSGSGEWWVAECAAVLAYLKGWADACGQ